MKDNEKAQALEEFSEKLNKFLMHVRNGALQSMNRNLSVPLKGLDLTMAGERAIWSAVVRAVNARSGHDCVAALSLSALILEDCNLHNEAKLLREVGKELLG